MSIVAWLHQLIGPPDPRSDDEIDRDIRAEFEFHIEAITSELIEAGYAPDDAERCARARFGDIERLHHQCHRIAREDQTMWQKVNAGLMIVVVLAIAIVSVQLIISHRANSAALSDMSQRLEEVAAMAGSLSETQYRVLFDGDGREAKWVSIEPTEVPYLTEFLSEQGVTDGSTWIRLLRSGADDAVYEGEARFLFENPNQRITLSSGDRILATSPPTAPPSQRALPDAQRSANVFIEGDVAHTGWYTLPGDEPVPLTAVLQSVGARDEQWVEIRSLRDAGTRPQMFETVESIRDARLGRGLQVVQHNDHIRILDELPAAVPDLAILLAEEVWAEIDEDGQPDKGGMTLRLTRVAVARTDASMSGLIEIEGRSIAKVRLSHSSRDSAGPRPDLSTRGVAYITPTAESDRGTAIGSFSLENNRLIISITRPLHEQLAPHFPEQIRFTRAATE